MARRSAPSGPPAQPTNWRLYESPVVRTQGVELDTEPFIRNNGAKQSWMLYAYLRSRTTVTERVAMGGSETAKVPPVTQGGAQNKDDQAAGPAKRFKA